MQCHWDDDDEPIGTILMLRPGVTALYCSGCGELIEARLVRMGGVAHQPYLHPIAEPLERSD
jgi:hypothetical protein